LKRTSSMNAVYSTQRSLRRGFGIRISDWELLRAGLAERERHYLALGRESVIPVQHSCWYQNSVPDGWYRDRGRFDPGAEEEFVSELIENSWERPFNPPGDRDDYWRFVRDGTSPYVSWESRLRKAGWPTEALYMIPRFVGDKGESCWRKKPPDVETPEEVFFDEVVFLGRERGTLSKPLIPYLVNLYKEIDRVEYNQIRSLAKARCLEGI
jgi:hypothetical protein